MRNIQGVSGTFRALPWAARFIARNLGHSQNKTLINATAGKKQLSAWNTGEHTRELSFQISVWEHSRSQAPGRRDFGQWVNSMKFDHAKPIRFKILLQTGLKAQAIWTRWRKGIWRTSSRRQPQWLGGCTFGGFQMASGALLGQVLWTGWNWLLTKKHSKQERWWACEMFDSELIKDWPLQGEAALAASSAGPSKAVKRCKKISTDESLEFLSGQCFEELCEGTAGRRVFSTSGTRT